MNHDWDYKGLHKEGIHTLGKYPAMMVPKMQLDLLKKFVDNDISQNKVLLDPFMGSGTAIVEARKIGMRTVGIDINPYAVLLTKVKTHDYSNSSVDNIVENFIKNIDNSKFDQPLWYFDNMDKWFRKDIILSLNHIRNAIMNEKELWIRRFLWVCMSEIIYEYSNDRTSTFKLHVKTQEQIENIKNNAINDFKNIVLKKSKILCRKSYPKSMIYFGDTYHICSSFKEKSIDIICTSPPYGDNATTVTYGQSSILFLKWINIEDIDNKIKSEILKYYTRIDRLSLGGEEREEEKYNSKLLDNYLSSINEKKQKKVIRFINDYWNVIKELSRIIKNDGTIIFTVGNRKVDGKEQPLDKLTVEMFKKLNIELIYSSYRQILNKKMPKRLSHINHIGSVDSMNKEKVLVFKNRSK